MDEGSIIQKMSMIDRCNTPDDKAMMQTPEWREAARRHEAKLISKAAREEERLYGTRPLPTPPQFPDGLDIFGALAATCIVSGQPANVGQR